MTNDEIKKALEICTDISCAGCPYKDNVINCSDVLKRDAIDRISEQEKEIERLKKQVEKGGLNNDKRAD